ncbi:MAG: hypothetical protein LBQ31_08900 [Bacteroidales bacterium]|nr:hypothetical protein [Bacteroidales bacterium]
MAFPRPRTPSSAQPRPTLTQTPQTSAPDNESFSAILRFTILCYSTNFFLNLVFSHF